MGKNKLKKFAEMEQMECVLQYPYWTLRDQGFPYRGRWAEYFGNDNPIVLELGCGKGEYTVGLARLDPDKNYIGVDIKGARMYTGAKQATAEGLKNVAFLRTSIELLPYFFAPGEVSELWITFPDPQMQKVNKRLTGPRMLNTYRQSVRDGGIINLKTDSPFLYTYTRELLRASGIEPKADTDNLYASEIVKTLPDIRTHYEAQWLSRGKTIKYLAFPLPAEGEIVDPQVEIPFDDYRSYHRDQIMKNEE
ncbi:MAG: tRNA (guanosine(46)-N7)-methyltransferase TrmB [Bacteroidales bacterium]|nr:tRNA (guanosine(46)-N7)-methyltransferase TrmB [Bacteroidales bacterium]